MKIVYYNPTLFSRRLIKKSLINKKRLFSVFNFVTNVNT